MRNAECGMRNDESRAAFNSSFIIHRSAFLDVVRQIGTGFVLDEEAVFLAQGFHGLGRDAGDQEVFAFESPRYARTDADDAAGWYPASRRYANLRADVTQLAD